MQLGTDLSMVLAHSILVYECSWEPPESGPFILTAFWCMTSVGNSPESGPGNNQSVFLAYCIRMYECSWEQSLILVHTPFWCRNAAGNRVWFSCVLHSAV
jgi:hypothetical protein